MVSLRTTVLDHQELSLIVKAGKIQNFQFTAPKMICFDQPFLWLESSFIKKNMVHFSDAKGKKLKKFSAKKARKKKELYEDI